MPGKGHALRDAGQTQFIVDGEAFTIDWAAITPGAYSMLLNGCSYHVRIWNDAQPPIGPPPLGRFVAVVGAQQAFHVEVQDPRSRHAQSYSTAHNGVEELQAPMPGRIVRILVADGARVETGEGLLVIEAMKMQNEVRATRRGRVEAIYVREGDGVETGSRLLRLG
jgi:glutaconyl-CoA/methylmalonyl-CoA decarboxylase subunit gamma